MQIKVSGAKELRKGLKESGHKLDDLKAVNLEAATLVANTARTTTAPRRTGQLAASVMARATATKGFASTNLIYAGPIHFGWRRHNIRPNPFLYDALDKRADDVIETYEKGVAKIIDQSFPGS